METINKHANKVLAYISTITERYINLLDNMLENDRKVSKLCDTCDDDENCDCYSQTLDQDIFCLNSKKILKFELEFYTISDYYEYNISILNKEERDCGIIIYSIRSKNILDLIFYMKNLSNSCISENKNYTSSTLNITKNLEKWISQYLDLRQCINCKSFNIKKYNKTVVNTKINCKYDKNNICLNCSELILNKKYDCSICLETNDNFGFLKLKNCGHIFHIKCFSYEKIKFCPLCRSKDIYNTDHLRRNLLDDSDEEKEEIKEDKEEKEKIINKIKPMITRTKKK